MEAVSCGSMNVQNDVCLKEMKVVVEIAVLLNAPVPARYSESVS